MAEYKPIDDDAVSRIRTYLDVAPSLDVPLAQKLIARIDADRQQIKELDDRLYYQHCAGCRCED